MSLWKNYMHQRERWYHQRDNNRLVRPFEWGLNYIVDHVVPLACNGPDRPSNMQWQTIAEAKAKDRWE